MRPALWHSVGMSERGSSYCEVTSRQAAPPPNCCIRHNLPDPQQQARSPSEHVSGVSMIERRRCYKRSMQRHPKHGPNIMCRSISAHDPFASGSATVEPVFRAIPAVLAAPRGSLRSQCYMQSATATLQCSFLANRPIHIPANQTPLVPQRPSARSTGSGPSIRSTKSALSIRSVRSTRSSHCNTPCQLVRTTHTQPTRPPPCPPRKHPSFRPRPSPFPPR